MDTLKIFSGNSNLPLAAAVSRELGKPLGLANITNFDDGESRVEIDESVRGLDVFVFQSTCCSASHNLMEFLIMIDALKRASAGRITAVLPYYGYARQDRKVVPRAPITAKLVADMITTAGAHRVLTIELHAGQIQGFFNIPVDHLFARSVLIEPLKEIETENGFVVVSPDAGGVERARAFAKKLNASLAIIDKRREGPNKKVMNIIGEVKSLDAIIVDDILDTFGTMEEAIKALIEKGVRSVTACGVHGVFSGKATERIINSPVKAIIITDTIPLPLAAEETKKVKVQSVSKIMAEAIRRIHHNDSVSSMFAD